MQLLPGKTAASRISGILHEKYQIHGFSVHLTVRKIFSLEPTGQIDFGGNEYVAAGRVELEPRAMRADDSYRWWELARGSYFVECNETLQIGTDEIALIEPEDRLLRAGASHVPLFVRRTADPVQLLLEVGVARLLVKQNARFARVRLFRMETGKPSSRASKTSSRKISTSKKRK